MLWFDHSSLDKIFTVGAVCQPFGQVYRVVVELPDVLIDAVDIRDDVDAVVLWEIMTRLSMRTLRFGTFTNPCSGEYVASDPSQIHVYAGVALIHAVQGDVEDSFGSRAASGRHELEAFTCDGDFIVVDGRTDGLDVLAPCKLAGVACKNAVELFLELARVSGLLFGGSGVEHVAPATAFGIFYRPCEQRQVAALLCYLLLQPNESMATFPVTQG